MSAEDKNRRKAQKSALTRDINSVHRYMAEEKYDDVTSFLSRIEKKFSDFEAAHNAYHDALTVEAEIDASDEYFFEVQKNYVDALKTTKEWIKLNQPDKKNPVTSEEKVDVELSRSELYNIFQLPQIKIETFYGDDPLKYPSFISIFDEQVDRRTKDDGTKLNRLVEYTGGDAKKAILPSSVTGGSEGYAEARKILKNRFGNDDLISSLVVKQLKNNAPAKSSTDLRKLADEMSSCFITLRKMDRLAEISKQSFLVEVVQRLPKHLQFRWKKQAMDSKRDNGKYPTFEDLMKFVSIEAENASDPIYGTLGVTNVGSKAKTDKPSISNSKSSNFSIDTKEVKKYPKCFLCNDNHRLFYCEKFKAMRPLERRKFVKDNQLCENCLLSNHLVADCRKNSVCSVPGCGKKHTKFIHVNERSNVSAAPSNPETQVNQVETLASSSHGNVCVPVVPVTVESQYETHALLDTGSTSSFCT